MALMTAHVSPRRILRIDLPDGRFILIRAKHSAPLTIQAPKEINITQLRLPAASELQPTDYIRAETELEKEVA